MCGICGVVDRGAGDLRDVVEAQLSLVGHRGPDARGSFVGRHGAIGQNRLSIIDLVHGDPPITNEDGSVAVALNGEIYNFKKLHGELRARGHSFSSAGDTEVIAHLAEELGAVELAQTLDGMFAFAVWDEARGRLVLGRDRLGKKPLYYACSGGRLVFGSEIKALFADRSLTRKLAADAIPAYLTFGYVPTPRTFYEGVHSLPPGHVLTFAPGGDPVLERYWQPVVAGVSGATSLDLAAPVAARRVRATLEAAVSRRLISDVPLGAFLSGGVDSSAIVGIMAAQLETPVQTFTIGFDDRDGFDERLYARQVATRHRTDHHEFVVHPNAVDLVERLVWHHDQPFGDSSAVPTFLLSELTRGHVTVALSGDGGDELFAGYQRFATALAVRRYRMLPGLLRKAIGSTVTALPSRALASRKESLQRFTRVAELDLPEAYRCWISFVEDPERARLLDRQSDEWALADYHAIWDATAGAHPLERLLDLNLRTYLVDDLLVKADRMSMAHGLEVRSPFLDIDLLALAQGLRPGLKMRGLSRKRVLKAAVADLVPREIIERPKHGFGLPLDRWFRQDLRSYVTAMLGVPETRLRDHLCPSALRRLLAEHDAGSRNHGHALWTLLTLEVFLRREGW